MVLYIEQYLKTFQICIQQLILATAIQSTHLFPFIDRFVLTKGLSRSNDYCKTNTDLSQKTGRPTNGNVRSHFVTIKRKQLNSYLSLKIQ